jgi:hypothetical protein
LSKHINTFKLHQLPIHNPLHLLCSKQNFNCFHVKFSHRSDSKSAFSHKRDNQPFFPQSVSSSSFIFTPIFGISTSRTMNSLSSLLLLSRSVYLQTTSKTLTPQFAIHPSIPFHQHSFPIQ